MEHPDHELLLACADGLLSTEQSDEIRAHTTRCPDCAAVLEREMALSAALRAQPLARPSPAFDQAVLRALMPRAESTGRHEISFRGYGGILLLCACTLVIYLAANGKSDGAPTWLTPVYETISGAMSWFTDRFVSGISGMISPLGTAAHGSNFIEIFLLATLALVLLGGLDRVIAPLFRKER